MKSSASPAGMTPTPKLGGGVGIAALFGAIVVLYFAREILVPFAFALTLTFLLTPMVALLERLRVGRFVSVLATVVISIALAGGIGWIIVAELIDVANQLPQYRDNIHVKIEAFHIPATGQLGRAAVSVQDVFRELSGPGAPGPAARLPRQNRKQPNVPPASAVPTPVEVVDASTNRWSELRDWSAAILAPLGRAGMVFIFTVFMLLKREDLRNRLLRLAGLGQLNLMTQALDDASGRVSRYLLMQFLVNAGFGTLFGLGLYCIGVPYPFLWGVVAAILRIVPYVGTLAAAMLPLALSLAVFDGWHRPLMVFAVVVGLELITGNLVEPWLYGVHVGISSLALLVTSVFWAVLWGPAGLILSTPLTVCVVVLGRYVPHLSFLHILLGDEPVLAPDAQLYQRLLAMDQQEARTIVDEFQKDRPLVELYDSVLVPALTMAEQDRHKGAIDTVREEFLFASVYEMIAEFSESAVEEREEHSARRIICIPAHDRADEITAAMLAQLLEKKGFVTLSFTVAGPSANEILAAVGAGANDVVCISSLPPYAFAPARALCKQIREQFPKMKVIVGVWGFSGDLEKAAARFERTRPDRLCTSMMAAVEDVQELAHPQSETIPLESKV
jgi:predicted PurR-regulated permease PerM